MYKQVGCISERSELPNDLRRGSSLHCEEKGPSQTPNKGVRVSVCRSSGSHFARLKKQSLNSQRVVAFEVDAATMSK